MSKDFIEDMLGRYRVPSESDKTPLDMEQTKEILGAEEAPPPSFRIADTPARSTFEDVMGWLDEMDKIRGTERPWEYYPILQQMAAALREAAAKLNAQVLELAQAEARIKELEAEDEEYVDMVGDWNDGIEMAQNAYLKARIKQILRDKEDPDDAKG